MEVVAGIAGVAGVVEILSLVGQAVHGILKLKEFAHRVSTASETVKSFLTALDSLEGALTAISDLLKRAPEKWLVGTEPQNTKRLTSQVESCRADVDEWVNEMPTYNPNSSRAIYSYIKKLRIASHEGTYSEFHRKVARHLQGMQMTLDILGCSYNIHILEKADIIAGDVKNLTEAQKSFNHEAVQKFPSASENFIAHLSPVTSQLDRLETSSQMSSASISSLASDVSRILELVSPKPALSIIAKSGDARTVSDAEQWAKSGVKKTKIDPPKLLRQLSKTNVEWSCDFLPGIEAAFSTTGRYCLYCGKDFNKSEWPLKGRHLVDEHRYGECNLRLVYHSEETFAQHIQEFHQCSLGHIWHLSNELITTHCQFGRVKGFHRGPESKHQHLTDDFHSIRKRRWECLFDHREVLKERHDHSDGAGVLLPLESVQHRQPVQRPSDLDLYTALFEEACIVDGVIVSSFFRPSSSVRRSEKQYYSLGDGIKVSRYEFDSLCDSFVEATSIVPTNGTNMEHEIDNAILPNNSSLSNPEIPKERSRINSWLQEILKSSSTTKTIMFHATSQHGVNSSDMYTWLEKVLEFWEFDEAATRLDNLESCSDGAIDSRGSPEIQKVESEENAEQLRMPLGWKPRQSRPQKPALVGRKLQRSKSTQSMP